MIKRMNKVTAMLVAAAAIVSVVPATAVSAATKLGTKDGVIENAVAFNGTYLFEGYKNDDSNSSVYFNNGSSDKEVEDNEDYTFGNFVKFGNKYLVAEDGDDYLLDLSTGKVTDDTVEDLTDDAATALSKALRKTDRYNNASVTASNITAVETYGAFADLYYTYAIDSTEKDAVNGKLYGLTDAKGKYIDISHTANVYAYSNKKGQVVKVEDFNAKADSNGLIAEMTAAPKVIAQDADYVYALVDVKVTDTTAENTDKATNATATIDLSKAKFEQVEGENPKFTVAGHDFVYGTDYTDAATLKNKVIAYFVQNTVEGYSFDAQNLKFTASVAGAKTEEEVKTSLGENVTVTAGLAAGEGNKVTNATYLQKISKAQGVKEDDAYLPKTVASYLVDNKSLFDNGDLKDAYDALLTDESSIINVQVKGSSLYVAKLDNENIKVTKLDLTKIKENAVSSIGATSKIDGYVVKEDGDEDQDIKTENSYSVDVNGNVWAVNNGKIYKFEGKTLTHEYTVDSAMDLIDVYDKSNLIAWSSDDDDEIYTTVTEGKQQTVTDGEDETEKPETSNETKWVAQENGSWKYMENGKFVTGWKLINGTWYLFGTDSVMLTGWQNVNGTWYYLEAVNSNGAMATGWKNINGTWYLFSGNGAMLSGWQYVSGSWYYLGTDGAMRTGWYTDTTGTWYYSYSSGAMASNTTIGGYKLGANGAWVR